MDRNEMINAIGKVVIGTGVAYAFYRTAAGGLVDLLNEALRQLKK